MPPKQKQVSTPAHAPAPSGNTAKPRGRPKKAHSTVRVSEPTIVEPKRARGRPPKSPAEVAPISAKSSTTKRKRNDPEEQTLRTEKRGRGRPAKDKAQIQNNDDQEGSNDPGRSNTKDDAPVLKRRRGRPSKAKIDDQLESAKPIRPRNDTEQKPQGSRKRGRPAKHKVDIATAISADEDGHTDDESEEQSRGVYKKTKVEQLEIEQKEGTHDASDSYYGTSKTRTEATCGKDLVSGGISLNTSVTKATDIKEGNTDETASQKL